MAYNRIKDWTVGRSIQIHQKRETPYTIKNVTKWIQIANDPRYCPIFPGDTRITMVEVYAIDPENVVPKRDFFNLLESEAADFLAAVLQMELPKSNDRLNIPVIETEEKRAAATANQTLIQEFCSTWLYHCEGEKEPIDSLHKQYLKWAESQGETEVVTLQSFTREMIASDCKIGLATNNTRYVINRSMTYKPGQSDRLILTIQDGNIYRDGKRV